MPRVSFLGDTLLGGAAQDTLDRLGYGHALDGIAPLFGNSDLVVANHEGPLTECVEPGVKHDTGRKRYWYRGKPEAACALADAGIRLVSLANNHVLDYGPAGLRDTIAALDAAGIAHCGAGNTRRDARRPRIVEVSGVRIGFVAYMQHYRMYADEGVYATKDRPGPAKLRTSNVAHDLLSLNNVDLRVVLVHWGRNYRPVNPRQRRLANEIVDAGADLIIGHHPHVAQDVEIVRGVPVFFSLGNGVLGTPGRFHSGRPPYGLVAHVEIEDRRISRVHTQPILVDNARIDYRPTPATDAAAPYFHTEIS